MNTEVETDQATEEAPKLNLNVKVEETSACERHVTVTVPREDIDRYFSEKFDELVPNADVPGFRKGKAPRRLIENQFREQVQDQVKGSLLMDSLAQISDTEDFSAISEPDFDFETIDIPDDGPMTYEFNIEVRPEFDLPEWKGLKLARTEKEFDDEDVDKAIREIGFQGDMVPVEEAAKADDFVVLSLTTSFEGNEVNSQSEVMVPLREKLSFGDAVLEDFGKLLIGAKAGDKKSAKVKVSEYSSQEEFQGKELDLEIELLEVKRMENADASAIAEKMGMEYDNLKEIIRGNLASRQEYAQRQELRDQIANTLTESATWELPQDLLRRQSRREMDRAMIELRSSGFSEQDILAQENQLRQNVLQRTEKMLKEHFILERIAESENIEDEEADYEIEIAKIAMQKNDSPRRVRARLERTGQMDAMRNMIIEQKVLAMIEESATIEAKKDDGKDEAQQTAAVDFFIAGDVASDAIPEAKYEDGGAEPLPAQPVERD